ncbi:N-acetylglucosamine kinase [Erythrobacter sp. LQ02-29]|uniref:N-acetylglucosamine kinase n=1 Tax=Erythrobacter sp. LQ02-29 TaxID=2920384 RepID=UPI001F4DF429|nr:BadF/BadG/BcrA/BcrD ATPase family protein [Erythrobacter sp. LQ02-29]MCP9222616.1 N-acetylglucosamine kinase [Erythrobacter sp. LQ02-29]
MRDGLNADIYLGVDGGGTKTAFTLIDSAGRVLAQHMAGSSYYLQIGLESLTELLREGVAQVCPDPETLAFVFFGLPAFGEDSRVDPLIATLPREILGHDRFAVGNDMVCGWAGSLGGRDGINIVAGTGSIAYGERAGKSARAGGWGEIFSDEGSAYWIATRGLQLFSRMSDGRSPPGPLLMALRDYFALHEDLDLCGHVMGAAANRESIAALSQIVAAAANAGDAAAANIFRDAASELAEIVHAVAEELAFAPDEDIPVSWSGGVFRSGDLVTEPFKARLAEMDPRYRLVDPVADPTMGAALYALRRAGNAQARSIAQTAG